MTVAFDAFSASVQGSGNLSWTHTPVGTPRAVIGLISQEAQTDRVVSFTYGGVSMTEVSGSPNIKTTGELLTTYGYFLGASVPTGGQTALVTVDSGQQKRAAVITLTAAADCEIVDSDGTINSDSQANPSVVLSLGGRTSFAAIVLHSGQGAVSGITPLANWTSRLENDYGADVAGWYTFDTIGSSDVTAGWTQTADDAVAIALAVSEVQAVEESTILTAAARLVVQNEIVAGEALLMAVAASLGVETEVVVISESSGGYRPIMRPRRRI